MDTNIKIVDGKNDLVLFTKIVLLNGNNLVVDDIEKVCSYLGYKHGISATPYGNETSKILINERDTIDTNWTFNLKKGDRKLNITIHEINENLKLDYNIFSHRKKIADLYKRALIIQINKTKKFWTFDSPRIFYEKKPFRVGGKYKGRELNDINVFRRYEISELPTEEGLGISIDVSTAFFTNQSVDYYFSNNLKDRFERLSNRQYEQKGTLLYVSPMGYSKSYFVKYDSGVCLNQTVSFDWEGEKYDSLYDYYCKRNPTYIVNPNDKIAYVSFPGLKDVLPVSAKKLHLRVMNEALDSELKLVDKIPPNQRIVYIQEFWKDLGIKPFGINYQGLEFEGNFLKLNNQNSGTLDFPDLIFNNGVCLPKPIFKNKKTYKENFWNRSKLLNNNGCYFTPLTMTRKIYFVYPKQLSESLAERFAEDICSNIRKLTSINVNPIIESYDNYRNVINILNLEDPSMVIFIFENHDPATYFNIRYELKNWDIKRVTSYELEKSGRKKDNQWKAFIEFNTLDVLQQLDCLFWTCAPSLNYDIHLAIDVSEKFTHFCLSFFMFKKGMSKPIIKTDVYSKSNKTEALNRTILETKLNNLLNEWSNDLIKYKPMNMLIIRDGKICDGELETIESVISGFKTKRYLPDQFKVDAIEYHKSSLKNVMLYENLGGNIDNCFEGSYYIFDKTNAFLATTGASTLTQGTANPILIRSHNENSNLINVLQDLFTLAQFNFSSPTVAQKNCVPIKNADEQLKDRKSQEVERIK